MRRSLDRLCESAEPVGLVELAQRLLAVEAPIDPGLARRVVGSALGRPPKSLPDPLVARDLGRSGEFEVFDLPLESADFVVVDLETTGFAAAGAVILEIGAVRVSRLEIVDHFETLVRPAGKLPRAIVTLTGITDQAVAEAPTPRWALRAFRHWLDATPAAPFVAHNAAFDHGFVRRAFDQWGFPAYRGPVLCTCKLARRLIPDLGRYNLDHLCAHLGISNRARHRALGDAKATASALIDLLHLAGTAFEVRTLGNLFDLHRRPPRRRPRRRHGSPKSV